MGWTCFSSDGFLYVNRPIKVEKCLLSSGLAAKKAVDRRLKRVYYVYNNKKRCYGYDRKNKRNRRIKSFV